jgi:hypothetical protein
VVYKECRLVEGSVQTTTSEWLPTPRLPVAASVSPMRHSRCEVNFRETVDPNELTVQHHYGRSGGEDMPKVVEEKRSVACLLQRGGGA